MDAVFSFLSLEGGFYLFFTRSVSEVTGFFFVPRLVLGPTDQREVICEFANFFSSHGESRRSRIFLSRFFSLSRIFEFSNFFFTRNVAEVTDFLCPEFANYRIVSSHGVSRRSRIFLSRFFLCHELSNYRISFTRNVAVFFSETCPWTH